MGRATWSADPAVFPFTTLQVAELWDSGAGWVDIVALASAMVVTVSIHNGQEHQTLGEHRQRRSS